MYPIKAHPREGKQVAVVFAAAQASAGQGDIQMLVFDPGL